MGVVIGQASAMGEMLSQPQAEEMIFGFTLLNDWSARDIQQWEYVPLGPFQGKAFGTSIGPWVVTREALEPFRVRGPAQQPPSAAVSAAGRGLQLRCALEVDLRTETMQAPATICRTNFGLMYWSSVQRSCITPPAAAR